MIVRQTVQYIPGHGVMQSHPAAQVPDVGLERNSPHMQCGSDDGVAVTSPCICWGQIPRFK